MGNLTEEKKINYISNVFHQYYDLELNTTITATTETINLVIPISSLRDVSELSNKKIYSHDISIDDDFNMDECLSRYEDTDIQPTTRECYCIKVIDGDTFRVRIVDSLDENSKPIYLEDQTIRLLGVDTPEMNSFDNEKPPEEGAEDSKRFLEKVCYNQDFYNKLHSGLYTQDSDLSEDELNQLGFSQRTGRLIENEVIVQKENSDELEELTATQKANNVVSNKKKIYLHVDQVKSIDKTEYNRTLAVLIVNKKNINQVMLKEGIAQIMYIPPCEFNSFDWVNKPTEHSMYYFANTSIDFLSPYFNSNMTNIVFTPQDDYSQIYRFEIYKDVIYVKLKPFSRLIRMHILPKQYDCSNNVLLLRDNMLHRRTIINSGDYRIDESNENINAYYQENSKDRDRKKIPVDSRPFNYNNFDNVYCEFEYDISDLAENLKNLMICVGYRYNQTSPYYAIHYTGVKDNHLKPPEDRCTLIDANWDNIQNKTNHITQMEYNDASTLGEFTDDSVFCPNHANILSKSLLYYADVPHTNNIGKLYQKKLKYINDELYVEEGYKDNRGYHIDINDGYNLSEWNESPTQVNLYQTEIVDLDYQSYSSWVYTNITGTLQDINGRPIKGALHVILYYQVLDLNRIKEYYINTKADGTFKITSPSIGLDKINKIDFIFTGTSEYTPLYMEVNIR